MYIDKEIVESHGINYTFHESGKFFYVGVGNSSESARENETYPNAVHIGSTIEEVVIPERIDGYRVLEIGGRAFRRCLYLKTVTIQARITQINMYAFYECANLTNINIPSSCEYIGNCAISCIYNDTTANGTLAVKFEPNATIKYVGHFAIERKDVIIIFFCGYQPPTVPDKALFYGTTYNVVFAPVGMEWGNTSAIVDESVCLLIQETQEKIKIQTCQKTNIIHPFSLFLISPILIFR